MLEFQKVKKLLELPGFVDVHVHLREPGGVQKEDFETGTRAAIAGGYTQILDMPNNIPPTISEDALGNKISRARGRIWCDIGFHFGATAESTKYFPKLYKKAFGLKVYMNQTTGSLLVESDEERELIFKSWQSNLPIMIHAEGETVEVAIKLAKKFDRPLHVCHIDYDQLASIQRAKKEGLRISCEVCPHHLFLNKESVKRLGPLGIMKPPLLSKKDQQGLWRNLDKIDMISTDHAPHTLEEKFDQKEPKFGVPGLETTLPLMLTAVEKGLLTLERLIEMTSTNTRKIFRLPNQPKTHIIVDTSKKYKIANKKLFTKCQWTPFKDLEGRGEVRKVVLRGETVFEDGHFKGRSRGIVIYPQV